MSDRLILLQDFVQMYGSRITEALDHFQKTDTRAVLVATLADTPKIVPDLNLRFYDVDKILANFDTGTLGTANALEQLTMYNPSTECVIGIAFPDRELLTFIVRLCTRK